MTGVRLHGCPPITTLSGSTVNIDHSIFSGSSGTFGGRETEERVRYEGEEHENETFSKKLFILLTIIKIQLCISPVPY